MQSKGRPPLSPVRLKNGFYIEVYNKGAKIGMKIRNESKELMEVAASQYKQYKAVVILGEYKDGAPLKKAVAAK